MGVILGIDPGLTGGLAALDVESGVMRAWAAPTITPTKGQGAIFDEVAMASLLRSCPGGFAVIEKVHAMPRQGVTSTFRFGEGYGLWRGVLVGLGVPYVTATPQVWKKALGLPRGLDHRDAKQAAIHFVLQNYPGLNLIRPRCRVAHDGMADAACLAHYGHLITRY